MDWYAFFRHVGNALNPAWISAILAVIGVIIALTIWCGLGECFEAAAPPS